MQDPLAASFQDEEEEEELSQHPLSNYSAQELEEEIALALDDTAEELQRSNSAGFALDNEKEQPELPDLPDQSTLEHSKNWSNESRTHSETDNNTEHADLDSANSLQKPRNPHLLHKPRPCCRLDSVLAQCKPSLFNPILTSQPLGEQPRPAILIEETQKMSDLGSKSYTAYIIRVDIPDHEVHLEARHRYSDFETLNRLLRRMHPTILVPPIPEKQSIADYATNPMGKPKEDPKMIDERKRLLQTFLNRVAMHPILGREHVFHGFLEGDRMGKSWAEVLAGSGVSHFLKVKDAKKAANSLKITDSLLKNPDPHYLAAEEYTYKFGQQLGLLTKYQKRMSKHLNDCAQIGTDLGAAYNGWSLTESGPASVLAPEIEALGQAIDCTVTSQHKLLHILEEYVTHPLDMYQKLTVGIDKTLKWRHALHVDYETATEGLVNNRANLVKLETTESEAQRVAASLRAELNGTNAGNSLGAFGGQSASEPVAAAAVVSSSLVNLDPEDEDENDPYAATRRALAGYNQSGRATSTSFSSSTSLSSSIINNNNHHKAATAAIFPPSSASILASFNSFIAEKDPEQTRRANIERTREKIRSLESERVMHLSKLGAANEAIQQDLDRFQRDKIHDVRNMLLVYASANRDHAKRCLTAWKEAQEVVDADAAAAGGGGGGGGGGVVGDGIDEGVGTW